MIGMLIRRMATVINQEPPTPPTPTPYDAQVEYLETDGTQWIDTNYIPQVGDEIYVDVYVIQIPTTPSRQTIFSAGNGTIQLYLRWIRDDNVLRFKYFSSDESPFLSCPGNRNHSISIDSYGNLTLDGSVVHSIPSIGDIDGTNKTLRLMYMADNTYPFYGRMKSFKLTSGGDTVLDLIPVRIGQVGYMYNRVDGTLLGNSGSGDFILGNDV